MCFLDSCEKAVDRKREGEIMNLNLKSVGEYGPVRTGLRDGAHRHQDGEEIWHHHIL